MKISARQIQRVAFPTDAHAPYHSPYAVEIACKIIQAYRPTVLVDGGDSLDFYQVSHFSRDPARVRDGLQAEIDAYIKLQHSLNDAAGKVPKFMLLSNHLDRWRKFVWENPELYGLRVLDIENVLELSKLGVKMVENIEIGKAEFRHGEFIAAHSAYTAKKQLDNSGYHHSIFSGHTHRLGAFFRTTSEGIVMAVESGGLFNASAVDYMAGTINWQNGLVLVDIVHGTPFPHIIPFFGRGRYMRAYWHDKEYLP